MGINNFYKQTIDYYDNCSTVYDLLYPDHLEYSNILFKIIDKEFKVHNVKTILDTSCGIGHDISILNTLNYKVDGTDVCKKMIEEANKRINTKTHKSDFFHVDVREINIKIKKKYDAVIFRGNSFSNIKPSEFKVVIESLYKVMNKNGLLLIDFRSGWKQFNEKKKIELRGLGYKLKPFRFYISWYRLKHAFSINDTYKVFAYIIVINFRNLIKSKLNKICISSHYVDDNKIEKLLKKYFKNIKEISVHKHGLHYLKNYLCWSKND